MYSWFTKWLMNNWLPRQKSPGKSPPAKVGVELPGGFPGMWENQIWHLGTNRCVFATFRRTFRRQKSPREALKMLVWDSRNGGLSFPPRQKSPGKTQNTRSKKICKRVESPTTQQKHYIRFQHILSPAIRDLRLIIYLSITWLLHTLIWGEPLLTLIPGVSIPWGIYGRFQLQKHHNVHIMKFVKATTSKYHGRLISFSGHNIYYSLSLAMYVRGRCLER